MPVQVCLKDSILYPGTVAQTLEEGAVERLDGSLAGCSLLLGYKNSNIDQRKSNRPRGLLEGVEKFGSVERLKLCVAEAEELSTALQGEQQRGTSDRAQSSSTSGGHKDRKLVRFE